MTDIERCSGILLHITSLPSRFGVGDLGPEAYRFADFLCRAKQRMWQILPLNPSDGGGDYSPYSGWSAFAGNTLLISPENMVRDGFLEAGDLDPAPAFSGDKADYQAAERYRSRLFDRAFDRFSAGSARRFQESYGRFCEESRSWLDDAARFHVLKDNFEQKSWQHWPDEIKRRDPQAIEHVDRYFGTAIRKEKFVQFIFDFQWRALRAYCNGKNIRLFGDIPIYVTADSADVWSHPELFRLDQDMGPESVSGVPPDYFSETGQLWGHPLYRWDRLQATGYDWWKQRIAHNLDLFDWIRLDHFRGLVAFWEVPASHKSAMNGRWVEAPAADFLDCLRQSFPDLPMIAEDLGIITDDVREIMRRYQIPGMRVALFAFGDDFPESAYLPHNMDSNGMFFTGTHDTNTVRGWFQTEATAEMKVRVRKYLGCGLSADNISWAMIRLVMISPARIALIPMQDVLGLDETARMNRPGAARGNWRWRVSKDQLTEDIVDRLADLTATFGRNR